MLRLICAGLLLAAAATLLLFPKLAPTLAGHQPLGDPAVSSLDEVVRVQDRGATEFFDDRNRLSLTVDEDTTALELLRLNHLDGRPHIRQEIATALGLRELQDTTRIPAGTKLELTLTPPDTSTP